MLHGYDIKIDDEDIDQEEKFDWTEDAFNYIKEIILGVEKQVWMQGEKNPEIKGKLKDTEGMLIGMRLVEFYLTQVYKQLADKEDQMIVAKFIKYSEACDEKPLFMLNLISNVITKCYPMMPRSKLDISNGEKYRESVIMNIMTMKKYMVSMLKEILAKLKEAKKKKKPKDDK